MSEDGEKAPPVDLAEDLNVSSDSSEADEAAVAVSSQEAAMDQGEDIPPIGPRPEPSTATAAVEEDRPQQLPQQRLPLPFLVPSAPMSVTPRAI